MRYGCCWLLLVIGCCWLLVVVGYWLLVVGYWLLVVDIPSRYEGNRAFSGGEERKRLAEQLPRPEAEAEAGMETGQHLYTENPRSDLYLAAAQRSQCGGESCKTSPKKIS